MKYFLAFMLAAMAGAQIPGDVVRDADLFDPREIPGLVSWWDASVFSGQANGTAIPTWVSRVNGYAATNAVAAQQPVVCISNGVPVVLLDGADDILYHNIPVETSSNSWTIAMNIHCADPAPSTWGQIIGLSGSGHGIMYEKHIAVGATNIIINNNGFAIRAVGLWSGSNAVLVATRSATSWVNGVSSGYFYSESGQAGSRAIGGTAYQKYVKFVTSDILIYTNALSTLQRQSVERYLSRKWHIYITQ